MAAKSGTSRRERMRRLVERWRASGERAGVFAQRHGVSPYKFHYWRAQFGLVKQRQGKGASFAPVRVVDDGWGGGSAALEIRLAGGDVIRCGGDFAVERLSAVVRALRERC